MKYQNIKILKSIFKSENSKKSKNKNVDLKENFRGYRKATPDCNGSK